MTAPIRFAILGFGHHAIKRLVPAFAACEHAVLTGIWRRNQAVAAENCRDYRISHCFPTPEALCVSSDVDAVFITSPDAMHCDDILLALRHGKAVLCEKPLSMQAAEAEEMVAVAETSGLLFGVAQNFRYNCSLDLMREKIAGGISARRRAPRLSSFIRHSFLRAPGLKTSPLPRAAPSPMWVSTALTRFAMYLGYLDRMLSASVPWPTGAKGTREWMPMRYCNSSLRAASSPL